MTIKELKIDPSKHLMKQPDQKSGRGGPRPGSGRKPAGRQQIVLRIKSEIIDRGAARKIRDIIERSLSNRIASWSPQHNPEYVACPNG